MDHIFTAKAIIDYQKYKGVNTYLLFLDAEKCFDKLWLKDCIVDICEAGVPPTEANVIYEMNKNATAIINTPIGETETIKHKEIVKQGLIFGSKLCCVSTDKINTIDKHISFKMHNLDIGSLIYVDDILGIGDENIIIDTARNAKTMETLKKFTFSMEKSKYMVIKSSKKK